MKIPKTLFIIIFISVLLRLPLLDKYPSSLYSDEISQGYNAFSILKTARDEYGKLLPISFRSFGDWKPPLQTYLMVPTITIFGLNAYGVRLPSAALGVATVWLVYFLIIEIIRKLSKSSSWLNQKSQTIALIACLFLTISPWHILQSRSAMLVCITLFFYVLGLWGFFKGLTYHKYFLISSFGFVLSIYGYYGMRLIVPITLVGPFICFYKNLNKKSPQLIISIVLAIFLLLPILISFYSNPNVIFGRAKTVSIFYDQGVALTVSDLLAQDGHAYPVKLSQFFHNKPYLYLIDIIRRFFEHFDGRFLFLIGDQNPPFQIPGMGILYLIDGIFLIFGLKYLIKYESKLSIFILVWLTISVIPAALTFMTPASNRIFNAVIPLEIISSIGIIWLLNVFKKAFAYKNIYYLSSGLVVIVYLVSFIYFSYQYFIVLPKTHSDWWHGEYKEMVKYAIVNHDKFDQIYISGKISVPYIFFLFYNQEEPSNIAKKIDRNYQADKFGFEFVDRLGKYEFIRDFNWDEDRDRLLSNSMLITRGDEKVGQGAQLIKQILSPDMQIAFNIYKINNQ